MSSFRNKNTKYLSYKLNNKQNSSINIKHKEKIKEILMVDEKITDYKNIIISNEKMIEELSKDKINNRTTIINLKDENMKYENMINNLQVNNDEINYYNNNIDILEKYYNDKTIDKIDDVNLFFNKNNDDVDALYNNYMHNVYNQQDKKQNNQYKICEHCNIEKTIHISEAMLVCTNCGLVEEYLVDNVKINSKDKLNENKPSLYKRINHLSELLNQFQAKETSEISKDIYKMIEDELQVQRITDYKKINYKMMRSILKKLNLNKYYEHIHHIINKLNKKPPPTITRETEEKIKYHFKLIQKPFELYKNKYRKNFSAYNSVIHKLLELLELDQFLEYFPLLKSREKREEFDILWEKICKYNNYQFIPSV